MKFIESYRQNLINTRSFSKITSFLMVICLFVEISENLYLYFFHAEQNWINEYWSKIVISLSFQSFIAVVILIRFVLLCFRNPKFIWYAQFAWLISWSSIVFYHLATSKILFGSFFGKRKFSCMDCFYYDTFLWASASLTVILLFYEFISPIKQVIIFVSGLMSKVETQEKT